jgi:hypothetical protein
VIGFRGNFFFVRFRQIAERDSNLAFLGWSVGYGIYYSDILYRLRGNSSIEMQKLTKKV